MTQRRGTVQSVVRASEVLLAIARGTKTLSDISRECQLALPTVHRLLDTLSGVGLVLRDDSTGLYALGISAYVLGDALADIGNGIRLVSRDILEDIRDELGHTVTVHVRHGTYRVCVAQAPSPKPVRYEIRVGEAFPLHAGSGGKLLLAYAPEDIVERVLGSDRELERLTPATHTDAIELRRELNLIREQGFATSISERAVGAVSIAVPIWAGDRGRPFGTLSVIGAESQVQVDELVGAVAYLHEQASLISQRLTAFPSRRAQATRTGAVDRLTS